MAKRYWENEKKDRGSGDDDDSDNDNHTMIDLTHTRTTHACRHTCTQTHANTQIYPTYAHVDTPLDIPQNTHTHHTCRHMPPTTQAHHTYMQKYMNTCTHIPCKRTDIPYTHTHTHRYSLPMHTYTCIQTPPALHITYYVLGIVLSMFISELIHSS